MGAYGARIEETMPESSRDIQEALQGPHRLTVDLPVDGLHSAGCASRVEGALKGAPGVLDATLSLATGQARVEFDPETTELDALVAAVEEAGIT